MMGIVMGDDIVGCVYVSNLIFLQDYFCRCKVKDDDLSYQDVLYQYVETNPADIGDR